MNTISEPSENTKTQKKPSSPWKIIHKERCKITEGMCVPQGVLIRTDILDGEGICTATTMVYVPFAVLVPSDQDSYQLISIYDGEMERMMSVVGKTVTKLERDKG